MPTRTGERACRPCVIRCAQCRQGFKVKKGEILPLCKKCGGSLFEISTGELELPGPQDKLAK